MAVTAHYFIVVSGERLAFTKDQLESEPECYFISYFFNGFSESSNETHELIVEKDIQLFKLIQAHLRGYDIFPIPDTALPSYMSREGALANLLREAQFYGLSRLEEKLHNSLQSPKRLPYKVTAYANGQWNTEELTDDGYHAYLDRFRGGFGGSSSYTALPEPIPQLKASGYKSVVSWVERPSPKDTLRWVLLAPESP